MKNIIKSLLKSAFIAFALFAFSVKGPDLHEKFLVNYKGDAVVKLYSNKGSGTGFNIKIKGKNYILTNRHVCNISFKKGMMFGKGSYGITLHKVIYKDSKHDLCLLSGIPRARTISFANNYEHQERIHIVGHPRGDARTIESGRLIDKKKIELVTIKGHKCEKKEELPDLFKFLLGQDFICITRYIALQSNAVGFGGNSGSPVLNDYGNLIGVMFAGYKTIEAASFFVPLENVKRFINEFRSKN